MKFLFAFQDTARKLRICTKERNQRGKRRQQKQPGIVYLMNRLQHSSVALAGLPLLTGTAVSSFCEDGSNWSLNIHIICMALLQCVPMEQCWALA
mmetsp:Transcript_25449/g.69111  ORF Transcript_25449/g.69111 Transcript_25449/m.69111 type:complete len:95 (-) Transcript_25449:1325-1609(-)